VGAKLNGDITTVMLRRGSVYRFLIAWKRLADRHLAKKLLSECNSIKNNGMA